MAKGELDHVLQHLCRPFHARALEALTDRELLENVLTEHDEDAFRVLVQRHAGLVMSVARRVLHDVHDAEDVFQATFLVLAQKSRAIRHRPALAGWLYQVAYRLAIKTRAKNNRQRAQERVVATMQPIAPARTHEHDELCGVLDEELSRLPEKYRTPILLHYFEGKTKDQTASQLGWTEGTVSGRLARARAILRTRLIRRGVVISSTAMTTLLSENAASALVSPTLLNATVVTGFKIARDIGTSGAASGSVAYLAHGVVKRMLAAKITTVTAIVAVALTAIVSWGVANKSQETFASLHGSTAHEEQVDSYPSPAREDPAKPDPLHLSASGRVIDNKGKPIAGAAVFLREVSGLRNTAELQKPGYTDILAQVTTDANGQFVFSNVDAEPMKISPSNYYRHPWNIVVMAKGHGAAWHFFQSRNEHGLEIRMPLEARLHGRLLQSNGEPAVGVHIQVADINGQIDPDRRNRVMSRDQLMLYWSRVPLAAVTDSQGRFVLEGLPRDYHIGFSAHDPRFLRKWLMYATIDNAEIDRLNRTGAVVAENKLQRDGFTATLQPNSTITGEVLDGDSGEPVAGAHVTLGLYGTYTDQRGRYSLERFDADKCHLSVAPPEGSTYLFTQADLTILPSEPARKHNFTLQRGSIITGQLREKETGAALRVPYVSIYYECEGPKRDVASARTKADGSYRMAVPAGKGKLFTYDSLPGCVPNDMVDDFTRNSVPVEIKPGETLTGKNLFFRRGMSVEGRVLDTDGKPVAGAVFQGVTEQLPSGVDGCFKLSGLAADEKSHFLIVHAQRRLGAKITIEPVRSGKPVALEVKLQPTQSGTVRVVDEKKRPLASVEVALIAHVRMRETDHGFGVLALPVYGPLRTDADGRIALPPLVADGSYSLEVSARGYAARTTRVRPQAGNALEVPDVVLLANDLTIAGVVLDATGEPVEGAQVSILPRNPDLAHTMHRSMNTPKDGRFHFSGLPKGTYRLIANLWKPTGETDAAGHPVNKSTASTQLLVEGGDETLRVVLRKQE